MRAFHKLMLLGALLCVAAWVSAQPLEIPQTVKPYSWLSQVHHGKKSALGALAAVAVETHRIAVADAPWVRLSFPNANLGENSYLTITSLHDGATQTLDAETLREWYNTSAYFNGNAVEVKLYLDPNDQGVFFEAGEITVGKWAGADRTLSKGGPGGGVIESQCGTTDDRVPSNHPASGRIVSVGCTGWIGSNGKHLTAGHCIGSSAATLQFDVPPSLSNGTIQHPGPEDQYSINQSNWQFVNGGVGNDWGIFQVFNNSETGLQPIQAQGGSFNVVQSYGGSTIRITGFGVDAGTANQTQQTHAGPNAGSSGTTMRYQTDTEGGNSGSPVIDEATGNALGIHTHGGCTSTGGNNSGTSAFLSAFWSAYQSVPCNNIAQGDPASASSTSGNNVASRGNDGSTTTFWRSGSGGTQWWQVDLGGGALSYSTWELVWNGSRYAKSYEIRVSNSSTFSTFTTVFSTTTGNGATDTGGMTGAPRTERYVRVHMTVPNAGHYRISEFRVCSSAGAAPKENDEQPGESITSLPAQFALHQNYPNPFNPSTKISYDLPEDGHVKIQVLNVLGEEVATLVDDVHPAGTHTVTFAPSNLPSGVYFYRLQAGEVRLTRQLLLMK
jgi:V8-like Glu-specific endopeptidase